MPSPDVLIIGSGAVGAACARALARSGARVTVVRPSPLPGEGWSAAAGMLGAQLETSPDDPLFPLGVAGRAFYRREADPLRDATGIDIGLTQHGILQIAQSEAQVEPLKAKVAWQRQQAESAEFLTAEEVADGWPWLEPGFGAFWAPEDGGLLPDRLVEALLADAVRGGARVIDDQVTSVWSEGGVLRGAIGKARHAATFVVVAAGAWSGRIAGLPRPLSVEPVRGQMLAWPWPPGVAPATVYGDRCYLLQRGEMLVGGSTMEHAGFDASTSASGVATLTERLRGLVPNVVSAAPVRHWAGLRPGTPDGLPIIGPEPRLPGLWYATGHGRNGILLAGVTGEMVAQGIAGEELPPTIRPFRATRFWNWW